MESRRRFARRDRPTVRQIYAVCAELCERHGEQFPETRVEASELIERLRIENGHPAPSLSADDPRSTAGALSAAQPRAPPDRLRY